LMLTYRFLPAQLMCLLNDQQMDVDMNVFAYRYADSNASLSSAEAVLGADSGAFIRNPSRVEVNYGFDQQSGWCKFYVRNTGSWRKWILKIQQSRVDTVLLYIVRTNHAPERFPLTGHFQTISKRPVYALPFAYVIPMEKGETVVFYLYTQREYGRHAAVLKLQRSDYFENYEHLFHIVIGLVCGMVLQAVLVGFVLFLFVKQRVYIYYSLYALSFFLVLMVDTGFAHSVISSGGSQTIVNAFTIAFYYWLGGWHLLFTVELLQLKKTAAPWFQRIGLYTGYFFCLAAILLLLPALPVPVRELLVIWSYYFIFPVTGYILYAISLSILKKEPIVYFYMAGFYFTVIAGTLLTLSDLEIFNIPDQNKDLYYLTPLVEILCVVMGIGIHFARTVRERYRVQLALTRTQDQIITIQEDERRRIAQDLHDDVGNSLAAIKNMVIQKRESTAVEKEMDTLIGRIRTISHDLMPVDFNDFSLAEIIAHTVNKFKEHPSIALEFDLSGTPVKIKPLTELVIFRIINELIINILKHSRGTEAYIQLVYQKESLVVTVDDNGVGMNESVRSEGIGLRSIQLRAAYVNATLKIESDDKGTLVILEVPYGKSND
jgi:signal transduction histidine kinase